jgi:hypothetical protein
MNPELSSLLETLRKKLESADATPVRSIDVKPIAVRDADEREDEPPDERDCERVGQVLKMVFGRPTCVSPKMKMVTGVPAVKRRPSPA